MPWQADGLLEPAVAARLRASLQQQDTPPVRLAANGVAAVPPSSAPPSAPSLASQAGAAPRPRGARPAFRWRDLGASLLAERTLNTR
jgi:hypothetical protein